MKKVLKPDDLKIGMYIEIPKIWLNHPFLKNKFKISSDRQIQKIKKSHIDEILMYPEKSEIIEKQNKGNGQSTSQKVEQQKHGPDEQFLPPDFSEKINDKNLVPEERAHVVYDSSITIMKKLFDNPTSENISEFKDGTTEIVKMILENDAITKYLLNITNYDQYTYTHSVNVGIYSILLAKSLFGDTHIHDMNELGAGFFLHDIGKVRIAPEILNKKGRLTEREFEIIKTHTLKGFDILTETEQLTEESKIIVLQHHERYDGSGYPEGLEGDQIHLYSKICSIADVFDALTSQRPYRGPMAPYEAMKLMKKKMYDHFQHDIFKQFVLLFK